MDKKTDDISQSFVNAAKTVGTTNGNPISEFLGFLRQNKKWWLLPILIAFLAVGILLVLGGTGAAPFIYTLF